MPYVRLTDLLHLPNTCRYAGDTLDEIHLTNSMHNDSLEMLHLRCGHISKSK